MDATWTPFEVHAAPVTRRDLPSSVFAFPAQRKEPLTDARHVISAVARFSQVRHVSDADRALALINIQKAAAYYGVHHKVESWIDLGIHSQHQPTR
jgi:hypothetical protein